MKRFTPIFLLTIFIFFGCTAKYVRITDIPKGKGVVYFYTDKPADGESFVSLMMFRPINEYYMDEKAYPLLRKLLQTQNEYISKCSTKDQNICAEQFKSSPEYAEYKKDPTFSDQSDKLIIFFKGDYIPVILDAGNHEFLFRSIYPIIYQGVQKNLLSISEFKLQIEQSHSYYIHVGQDTFGKLVFSLMDEKNIDQSLLIDLIKAKPGIGNLLR